MEIVYSVGVLVVLLKTDTTKICRSAYISSISSFMFCRILREKAEKKKNTSIDVFIFWRAGLKRHPDSSHRKRTKRNAKYFRISNVKIYDFSSQIHSFFSGFARLARVWQTISKNSRTYTRPRWTGMAICIIRYYRTVIECASSGRGNENVSLSRRHRSSDVRQQSFLSPGWVGEREWKSRERE